MLTDADKLLLPAALRQSGGYSLFCQYYFDYTPTLKQFIFHQVSHPNVTWLASIAAGKTTGTAASTLTDCFTLPGFKALSTSITSVQAEIQFHIVQQWLENNKKLEHHIKDIKNRPYPTIYGMNGFEWTFRTIGYEAKNIRGLEFDRVNLDEAAFEPSSETVPTLRGRLRGNRIPPRAGRPGVPRMARLDLTSSPADTLWFKDVWKKGEKGNLEYLPQDYLSIRSTIYDNPHLTPRQIELMKASMSDEQIRVELEAQFPDYGDSLFPVSHIESGLSSRLNDEMEDAIAAETPGYALNVHPRHGIFQYYVPPTLDGRYVMAGDPGMGDPPLRNAGVVMCFDTSKLPYTLVYFDWVNGKGSYKPFIHSYKLCLEMYNPLFKGLDATGPSTAIDELAFEDVGITTDALNFQADKPGMINALSMAIVNRQFRYPVIQGLYKQLSAYKLDDKKLAQDIVMTMAQIAYLCRMIPKPGVAVELTIPMRSVGLRSVGGRVAGKRR